MPIKPRRRPVVSQATGRPSGDTRDRAPSSTRAPHGRDPQGRDSTRSESSPGARPGFRSAGSDAWRAGDERRPASPPGGAARGASWGAPPRPVTSFPCPSGSVPFGFSSARHPITACFTWTFQKNNPNPAEPVRHRFGQQLSDQDPRGKRLGFFGLKAIAARVGSTVNP